MLIIQVVECVVIVCVCVCVCVSQRTVGCVLLFFFFYFFFFVFFSFFIFFIFLLFRTGGARGGILYSSTVPMYSTLPKYCTVHRSVPHLRGNRLFRSRLGDGSPAYVGIHALLSYIPPGIPYSSLLSTLLSTLLYSTLL